MTDKPTSDAGKDAEAATGDAGVTGKRPSPSAQAASRARRIGGRPMPGRRPTPTGSIDADADAKPAQKAAPAAATSATKAALPKVGKTAGRGGKGSARTAAPDPAGEAKAPSLTKRTARPTPTGPKAGSAAETEAMRRRLDLLRWVPAGVLGVAVVVLAVLCIALGSGVWYHTKSAAEVRTEVLSAAKTCTAKVSSYDYRKLAQAQKDGAACATGNFKADYQTAMNTIIAKEAPKTKTTQTLQVAKAGIEQISSDGKQWTLLVYGQHTVTNTGTKTPRLDKLSVRVTMDKVGGKWLISKLDIAN